MTPVPLRALPCLHRAALACLLALSSAALPAHAGDPGLSGDVSLTSDYRFRGMSQTLGAAAPQAGARHTHGSGALVAGWTSNVDYGPDLEGVDRGVDLVVGIERSVGALSLDLSHARYLYPGASPGGSPDYSEWLLTAGLGERWSASMGWSDDVFASGTSGTYAQLAYTHPLTAAIALRATAGEYRFGGDLLDYRHGEVGATWSHGRWEGRLTWHTASDGARENFGGQAARDRVEAAVTFGF